jgi:hypothetical protein
LAFHPSPNPFDPENPPKRPLFLNFQPVCVKFGQSVEWMTGCKILGLKGADYEKVMDVFLGWQPVDG